MLIKKTKQLSCLHQAHPSPEGVRGCWGSQNPIPWLPALCLCSDNCCGPSQLDSHSIAAFLTALHTIEALCFPWEYSPVAQEGSAATVRSTAAVTSNCSIWDYCCQGSSFKNKASKKPKGALLSQSQECLTGQLVWCFLSQVYHRTAAA